MELHRTLCNCAMTVAVNKTDPQTARRDRIYSFRMACLASVAVLLFVVAWIFIDASFHSTIDHSLMLTRLRPNPGLDLKGPLAWNQLGVRIAALVVLAFVGVAANVVVVLRLFFGRSGGRSIAAFLAATALVGAWLTFFLYYDDLQWKGFTLRLSRRLPDLKLAFEELRDHWPDAEGTLPFVGSYRKEAQYPNLLTSMEVAPRFPFNEETGGFIHRQASGVIQIDLLAFHGEDWCKVEYVPAGAQLSEFVDVFEGFTVHYQLKGSQRLDEHVYLTWYSFYSPELDLGQ